MPKDPREGEEAYEQARRLMQAVDAILQDTAEQRSEAQKLPGRDEFILTPLWTETREDRETRIRDLLDSALGIVTDVPVVEVQKKIEGLRQNIREHRRPASSTLKEKQITAPKDAMLPGVLNDTVEASTSNIEDAEEAHRPRTATRSPRPRRRSPERWPSRASSCRRSRSTCCSTACCRATSCASSPYSTRPR